MYRRYRMPPVWRELNRIQQDMNRLMGSSYPSYTRMAASYPPLNIWSNEEGLVITAEVPGISPDEIEISVVGETLTLSGVRKAEELQEGTRYHRQERGSGKFSRTIQLPFPVNVDEVNALFVDGVLEIKLPRTEADKPRKIAVESA